jgi:hypothetical protein
MLSALLFCVCAAVRAAAQIPVGLPPTEEVPLFPTRQPAFDIPFQIDEPIPGQEPVEVQLHVSDDRGTTWNVASKVNPDTGRFSYRAARDGEYWFLVRTLNRQGRLLPEKPFTAEMRVLVDTEPPQLEVNCHRGNAGEVYCLWKTIDPHLKAETLQLAYQGIDGGPQWQPVAVAPSTPAADGAWSGRTTFVPLGVKWPLFVRVEVSDIAGNRATAQVQVQTAPGVGPNALPITNSLDARPSPFAPPSNAGGNWQPATTTPPASDTRLPPALEVTSPTPSSSDSLGGPPAMASSFPGRVSQPPPSEAVP